ncbi:MAG: hypothetical protein HY699_13890 [Deltaproteobacteria bacterium]|nr:hypothetical protein [Deltaproteobacteria bacterium]
MTAPIHELHNAFDERNMFLQVALGLISFCRQIEAGVAMQASLLSRVEGSPMPSAGELIADSTLETAGAADPACVRTPAGELAPPAGESPVLAAVLGLVAFSQQLLLHAERASREPAPAPRATRARRPRLRRLLA